MDVSVKHNCYTGIYNLAQRVLAAKVREKKKKPSSLILYNTSSEKEKHPCLPEDMTLFPSNKQALEWL